MCHGMCDSGINKNSLAWKFKNTLKDRYNELITTQCKFIFRFGPALRKFNITNI